MSYFCLNIVSYFKLFVLLFINNTLLSLIVQKKSNKAHSKTMPLDPSHSPTPCMPTCIKQHACLCPLFSAGMTAKTPPTLSHTLPTCLSPVSSPNSTCHSPLFLASSLPHDYSVEPCPFTPTPFAKPPTTFTHHSTLTAPNLMQIL